MIHANNNQFPSFTLLGYLSMFMDNRNENSQLNQSYDRTSSEFGDNFGKTSNPDQANTSMFLAVL